MSDGRRSPAYRDYRRHRLWLLACEAALEQAFADRLTVGAPTEADRYSLAFDVLEIRSAIKGQLVFADTRMKHGDKLERETVAEMLGYFRRALAALPEVVRYVDMAETTVRVADERSAEAARQSRSKRKSDRIDVVRPLYWRAVDAACGGQPNFQALGNAVQAALKTPGLQLVCDTTLRRYMESIRVKGRGHTLPN